MSWFKNSLYVCPKPPVFEWTIKQRALDAPADQGSTRVTIVDKSCIDINRLQLDPAIVTLDSLIASGEKIEPGDVRNLLTISDKADIESYNSRYVQDAYLYLKEHKDEIFKSAEK